MSRLLRVLCFSLARAGPRSAFLCLAASSSKHTPSPFRGQLRLTKLEALRKAGNPCGRQNQPLPPRDAAEAPEGVSSSSAASSSENTPSPCGAAPSRGQLPAANQKASRHRKPSPNQKALRHAMAASTHQAKPTPPSEGRSRSAGGCFSLRKTHGFSKACAFLEKEKHPRHCCQPESWRRMSRLHACFQRFSPLPNPV